MYREYVSQKYNEIYDEEYARVLDGRSSVAAKTEAIRHAQHVATRDSFTLAYREYGAEVGASKIWNAVYSIYLKKKIGIEDLNEITEEVIDSIVGAAQSWKKSSGHAFEDYVVLETRERLSRYNIRFVLQKELTAMLNANQIANEEDDMIRQMAESDNFDAYALVDVNGNNVVFGCIQVKTSIRDRVGRDRDFSIPAMNSHFWSVAVVLDGGFLNLPKFSEMVNGGGIGQYQENGWHAMYSMSDAVACDRIYVDEQFEFLIEDARQAAQKFTSARQRFDRYWRAIRDL